MAPKYAVRICPQSQMTRPRCQKQQGSFGGCNDATSIWGDGGAHGVTQLSAALTQYFSDHPADTPYLAIDLDVVEHNYKRLKACMPDAQHHYAIKANPHQDVLRRLNLLGGWFEVASVTEIEMCLEAGVPAERILYGNPLKKADEIAKAHALGIRRYVFDNILELQKIAEHAPKSSVLCRIVTSGEGAVSPLTIKFGCPARYAAEWLAQAPSLGLVPLGVSFHTGSQQLDPAMWRAPLADAAEIFKQLRRKGITLSVVNVGGGFPVNYRQNVPDISEFGRAITGYVSELFKDNQPTIYTEPGRYMVGDAGSILAEVVLISPSYTNEDVRWVYLDIGRYGGLVEEKIDYPILTEKKGQNGKVILAGQTCDSNDVIYPESFGYTLPQDLAVGDKVILAHTGAYTTTYSTALNGFRHLHSLCIGEKAA